MGRLIGSLMVLAVSAGGALAAEQEGAVTVGKAPAGVKLAKAECEAMWNKANPGKKPQISAGQAIPFITDIKAASTNGDSSIDQSEFMAACDKGLIKQASSDKPSSDKAGSASTGSSSGSEGAGAAGSGQ